VVFQPHLGQVGFIGIRIESSCGSVSSLGGFPIYFSGERPMAAGAGGRLRGKELGEIWHSAVAAGHRPPGLGDLWVWRAECVARRCQQRLADCAGGGGEITTRAARFRGQQDSEKLGYVWRRLGFPVRRER